MSSPDLLSPATSGYTPLAPARLLDTRGSARLGRGRSIDIQVTGVGGVPAEGVEAVVLDIAVYDPTASGWVVAHPTGQARPTAASLYFGSGQSVSNLVIAEVGDGGKITVFNRFGRTHLVVDVQGWFAPGSGYTSVTQSRLFDTHQSSPVGQDSTIDLQVTGVGGIPADGVEAVVLNVSVTMSSAYGWLVAYPAGEERPLASNLNFGSDRPVSNLVIAKVGEGGMVSLYNSRGSTHLVVDVQGWFTPDAGYTSVTQSRLLDTRQSSAVGRNSTIDLQVTGVGGIPAEGVEAVAINVIAVRPSADGSVTAYSTGGGGSSITSFRTQRRRTLAKMMIVEVGEGGMVSLYNSRGSTHLVVDVQGWFGSGPTDPEEDGYGWSFVPQQVLLAPGGSTTVRLVQTDQGGEETGAELPSGVGFVADGSATSAVLTSVGGDLVSVVAGAGIGSVMVAAEIPGHPVKPALTVVVAGLNQGVVALEDEAVLYPSLDVPPGVDPAGYLPEGVDESGPGPFTWDQLADRLKAPPDDFLDLDAIEDFDEIIAAGFHYPVVVDCPSPAAGSIVVGSGSSGVAGRVIEPPGLPSLEIDGWCLVTVEMVGLHEIYSELHYDLSYDDLLALGLVPEPVSYSTEPIEPEGLISGAATPLPAQDPPDPNASTTVAGPGSVQQGGNFIDRAKQCVQDMAANPQWGAAVAEFQPAITMELKPVFDVYVDIANGTPVDIQLRVGLQITGGVQAKLKLQAAINIETSCLLAKIGRLSIAAPGPLAPFLDFYGEAEANLKIGLKVDGGPRAEIGFGCSVSLTAVAGFAYNGASGSTTNLSDFSLPPPTCTEAKDIIKVSSGLTEDGVGISVEASVGTPLTTPAGLRMGGATVGAIAAVLNKYVSSSIPANPGQLDVLKGEVGPTVKLVWENASNVVSNSAAKSGIFAEFGTKVFLELQPLVWFLGKFGGALDVGAIMGGQTNPSTSEFPIFSQTVPLATAYAPLNNTRLEVTVGGEEAGHSPAIYVQEGQELNLLAVMAPSAAGLTNPLTPQITEGWLYRGDGSLWSRTDLLGVVAPAQSTGVEAVHGNTSLRLQTTISEAVCNELSDEPVMFRLVGNAPMGVGAASLPTPGWGGEFNVQCVDGKVGWEPDEVLELGPTEVRPLKILTRGATGDILNVTGLPAWLSIGNASEWVVPMTIDEDHEIALEIRIDDPGVAQCEPREVTLSLTSEHRGTAELRVTEDEKCYLRFTPNTVTGPGPVSSTLFTEGYEEMSIPVETLKSGLPDWIHWELPEADSPPGNPYNLVVAPSTDTPQQIEFRFTVDEREPTCVDQPARAHDIQIDDANRGQTVLHIHDPKIDKLENCGFKFTPNKLTNGGTSSLSIHDDVLGDSQFAVWEISGNPGWMTVTPSTGGLANGASGDVDFSGAPPVDYCTGRAKMNVPVFADANMPDGSTRTATIVVTYDAVPANDCQHHTGGAYGDPHMVSFDGARWEGQTLGEYIYAESLPGAAYEFQIIVRHQPTNGQVDSSIAPTSITAVAVELAGSLIEMYAGDRAVYVDGVEVELAPGVPIAVGSSVSMVITNNTLRIDAPGLVISRTAHGSILDLSVSVPTGQPVRGLLGSPDGEPANDFVGSDGTIYTYADISSQTIPTFGAFNQSWRLTTQADSPFSRQMTPTQFSMPSPGFDQAIFDEWGDDADAILASISTVCDNGNGVSSRKRYAIALELAIGTPSSVIENYLCHYEVLGAATVDGQGVPGLTVTIDGDGLEPCVTTTGSDGRFLCVIAPDSFEAAGVPSELPLELDVIGTWAGRAGTAASSVATFASLASTEGSPATAEVNLILDAGSVPVLEVSGEVRRDGEPVAGDRDFQVVCYGPADEFLGFFSLSAAVDSDTAQYSFHRALPGTAVRAVVTTVVGTPVSEGFTAEFVGLELGPNPVEFDVIYEVPTLRITGTATNGFAGLTGPLQVVVRAMEGSNHLPTQYASVTPNPLTGSYSVVVPLPRETDSARAAIQVPPYSEEYQTSWLELVPGSNEVTLDLVHAPPLVTVSGTMVDEHGSPLTGPIDVVLVFYDSTGGYLSSWLQSVTPDPLTGAYSFDRLGLVSSATVRVAAHAGSGGETFETGEVSLVPGANSVNLDVALNPVELTVSGDLTDYLGGALAGPIEIYAFFYAGNTALGYSGAEVVPGVGGEYTADFVGHRNADRAEVRAFIGVSGEFYELDVGGLSPGQHSAVLDVVHQAPILTLTGTMIDTPTGLALTGPILVRVIFNGFGGFLSDEYVSVTPSALDGSYNMTVTGHHSATSAHIVAHVGQFGETVEADVPVLYVGQNDFPFHLGFGAPVVTLYGTMLGTGGVPLTGEILIAVEGYDDSDNYVTRRDAYAQLAPDGTYSVTVNMPASVTSVNARAFVGNFWSDRPETGMLSVVAGNQTIPFDVLFEPVVLQLSGTMTKAPGVALTGPIFMTVTSYSAANDYLGYVYTNAYPQAGTGSYSFDATLPQPTDHVVVQSWFGSEVKSTELTGFAPGGTYSRIWDIVFDPPSLTVHGTAAVNGVPLGVGQNIQVRVVSTVSGQVGTITMDGYPAAETGGAYSTVLVLPDGTTSAVVSVKAVNGANWTSQNVVDLQPNEVRDISMDFDDITNTLDLDGTLKMFGLPAQFATLSIYALDAQGSILSGSWHQPILGADGSFAHSFAIPDGTVSASVNVSLSSGYSYLEQIEVTGLGAGANARTLNVDTTLLELSGTLLENGVPLEVADGDPALSLLTSYTRNGQLTESSSASWYDIASGEFEYAEVIPGDVTSATVKINGIAVPEPEFHFDNLSPGTYSSAWNIDIGVDIPRLFTVEGDLTEGGSPWSPVGDTIDAVVTLYELDPSDAGEPVPWTVSNTLTPVIDVDPVTGHWTWSGNVPASTSVVTVELPVEPGNRGLLRTFVLPATLDDVSATFDLELGSPRISFENIIDAIGDCTGPTLMVEYQVWAFAVEPVDKTGPVGTWAGATELDTFTAIPDLATHEVYQAFHPPDGYTFIQVEVRPSSIYTSGPWATSIGFGLNFDAQSWLGFGGVLEFTSFCGG